MIQTFPPGAQQDDERPGESSLRVALNEHTLDGLSRVVRKAHRAGVPDEAVVTLGRKVVEFRWVDDDEDLEDEEPEDDDDPA
jgi:hypothetical protein